MTMIERQVLPIAEGEASVGLTMTSGESGGGSSGLSRRSHQRLYYNALRLLGNVDYFVRRMVPWAAAHIEQDDALNSGDRHRRIVGRFMMTETRFEEAMSRSQILRENIEVVIPVGAYHGDPVVMSMWGINNHHEQTIDPVNHMVHETEYDRPPERLPADRIDALRSDGYDLVNNFNHIHTEDILSLWGPIFGWEATDIDNLRERMRGERNLSPEQRSVWFTAVLSGHEVVALAMAERLDLPLDSQESQTIIESTEWCVRPGWQHRGLGAGAVSYLHAQVVTDLEPLGRPPVIIAETNFTSRADHIGHSSAMIVGPRTVRSLPVSQVLRQNVAIGDGLRPEPLRDFTMMYIPPENIERYYSSEQRSRMLRRDV